ncbi:MAG: ATP-binding protein, partial [Candidatus Poribacteria bacterium]
QYCEKIREDNFACSDHYSTIVDYVKNYQMPYIQECHAGLLTIAYPLIIQDVTQETFSEVLIGVLFLSPISLREKYDPSEDLIENVRILSKSELMQIERLIYAIFGEIIDSSKEIAQIIENSVAYQNELTLLYDFVKKAGGKINQREILINIQNMLNTNIKPSKLLIFLDDEYIREFTLSDESIGKGKYIKLSSISRIDDDGFLAETIKTGKTIINNNINNDSISYFIDELVAQKGMACPIKFSDKLIGLMVLLDKEDDEDFFADDAKFAETLAASMGIVLETVYLATKLAKSETWKEVSFRAAHKIGNALFALKGPIAQMKQLQNAGKLSDEKILELTKRLDERMKEADAIIRSVKDYIRPNDLNLSQEDVNSILEKVIDDMKMTIGDKISLKLQLNRNLPSLKLDAERISRAIEELIQNATYFIENGGEIAIRTDFASRDEKQALSFLSDDEFIAIEVSDNGKGISDDDKERIFYPFFSTRASGTGQGLAIVSTDVQLHGGAIKEVGKFGEGAKFLILLPIN